MCGSSKEAFVANTGMGQAHCNELSVAEALRGKHVSLVAEGVEVVRVRTCACQPLRLRGHDPDFEPSCGELGSTLISLSSADPDPIRPSVG